MNSNVSSSEGALDCRDSFKDNIYSIKTTFALPIEYEEKFKLVFENAPLGIAVINPFWKIIDANQKFCDILKYSLLGITGKDIRQITFSKDLGSTFQHMTRVQNGEIDSYDIKKRYIRSTGEIVPVHIHSAAIRSEDGNLVYSILMVQDLSIEEEQNEQLKLLGHSINSISEMISITNQEDKFIFVNQAFLDRYGYIEEEVLGKTPAILNEDQKNPCILIKGGSRWQGELVNVTKSGEKFHIKLETSVVKNDSGEPIGNIGIAKDITEQMKAEETLRKLSKAVEQNPAAIIITDSQGIVEYVNPKFVEVTGFTPEEIIGKTPRILRSGNKSPDEYAKLWSTILSGEEWTGEFTNKKKDGTFFREHVIISPIKNADGEITHFVAVKEDITERREAEEKLKRAETLASLGRMTSYLSHEIKSPLTAIKLNIEVLMEQMKAEEEYSESFRIINKEIKRLDNLLKDVLQFSKQRQTIFQDVSPSEILKQVMVLLHPVLESKKIKIINQVNDSAVKGDPGELKTIFHQLIENSIEAIGSDGEIEFLSVLDNKRKMHRIFIRDTGCGIKSAKRIFEPFYTSKQTGTGLGLSIVQQIIENHNGTISLIFSEPGNTIFQISLPQS